MADALELLLERIIERGGKRQTVRKVFSESGPGGGERALWDHAWHHVDLGNELQRLRQGRDALEAPGDPTALAEALASVLPDPDRASKTEGRGGALPRSAIPPPNTMRACAGSRPG